MLEGIDGAGKTEQSMRLAAWLREQGRRVVETREPTDGVWGRRYRAWARGDANAEPDEVLHYFVEDRREHVERVIGPALERGDAVVCDRYRSSTLAYQAAQGIDPERLLALSAAEDLPEPDLEIWLRLPPARALERLTGSATERFERTAFLERVDAEYARLGLEPVDAAAPTDVVEAEIRERVAAIARFEGDAPAR